VIVIDATARLPDGHSRQLAVLLVCRVITAASLKF
jgi:hypothetical protein